MAEYTDKDFVDVVDEAGEPWGSVPKAWIGTDLLPAGVKKAGKAQAAAPDAPVEIPEGDPSEDWTGKQLDAYAERESIDLKGASSKAEKVAAIAASKAAPQDPPAGG